MKATCTHKTCLSQTVDPSLCGKVSRAFSRFESVGALGYVAPGIQCEGIPATSERLSVEEFLQ
jgi:hypothetical protein